MAKRVTAKLFTTITGIESRTMILKSEDELDLAHLVGKVLGLACPCFFQCILNCI